MFWMSLWEGLWKVSYRIGIALSVSVSVSYREKRNGTHPYTYDVLVQCIIHTYHIRSGKWSRDLLITYVTLVCVSPWMHLKITMDFEPFTTRQVIDITILSIRYSVISFIDILNIVIFTILKCTCLIHHSIEKHVGQHLTNKLSLVIMLLLFILKS